MSKAPKPVTKQLTRPQLSRRAKEERASRILIISAAAVLGLVVLVLGYGLLNEYVLKPNRPVAKVAGVPIRVGDYQKLVQYRRADYRRYISSLQMQSQQYAAMGEDAGYMLEILNQQIQYSEGMLANVPYAVIDELIEDQITRQESALRGIAVAPDEVDLEIEQMFGYDRNPPTLTPTPITATVEITVTPTATVAPMTLEKFQSDFAETIAAMRTATGFDEKDFRRLVESSVLRTKLEESIGSTVSLTGEHVHVLQILVETREEADAIVARLDAGEEWNALAAELSTESATSQSGGDMGWFMRGQKGETFDAVVFTAEPDPTKTLVIEDDYGFHVVRVLERDPARFLSETDLESAKRTVVTEWFAERRNKEDVVNLWENWMVPADTGAIR